MPQPAFAAIQTRAEESALRRLANVRLAAGVAVFDALLAIEVHPMGLVGEMGELRHCIRLPRADCPVWLKRDDRVGYDPASYTIDELIAKDPREFQIDAIEPYGASGVRIWLR